MLRFLNIRELHAETPKAIEWVSRGGKCIVLKRGKPKALLLPLSEDEIEDLVLGHETTLKELKSAEKEADRRGWKTLKEVRKELGLAD